MKTKIILAFISFITIISCTKPEDCNCNEFLISSNGNSIPNGQAPMSLCDGTLANPTPQLTSYQKECK